MREYKLFLGHYVAVPALSYMLSGSPAGDHQQDADRDRILVLCSGTNLPECHVLQRETAVDPSLAMPSPYVTLTSV